MTTETTVTTGYNGPACVVFTDEELKLIRFALQLVPRQGHSAMVSRITRYLEQSEKGVK